ncbi:hypothetical protein BHE74_00025823 [Ensete ventricosum]|nr:hypothetical protein GW17_00048674 [Ensete ventricosum]RWW66796.1 hypothetical protein BHE74_00025823 [Ensete ventricosum]RZS03511.1 hypothetical protein BHM03_00033694 [Ensete ventricosum]
MQPSQLSPYEFHTVGLLGSFRKILQTEVLPELFPMQLCIIWHMNNIVDGSFLVFLMWERVLFLILFQGR